MNSEAWILLTLLTATVVVFALDRLAVEVTALSLLAALVVTGIVSAERAVSGFSNRGVVTIGGLFVISHALSKTGFLEVAADWLSRRFGSRPSRGIGALLVAVAVISGFLNNTAVVALGLPLVTDVCRRFQVSVSKVLIPLSYAAIFGGTLTLIGTSTNLVVSALAEEAGLPPIGMFEIAPLGFVFLVVGLLYVAVFSNRLPARAGIASLTGKYGMEEFLAELRVVPGSKMVDRTVVELDMSRRFDVTTLAIERSGQRFNEDLRALALDADDVLTVRGSVSNLLRLRDQLGGSLISDVDSHEPELPSTDQILVEALVPPNSNLIGQTPAEIDFRRRFRAFVVAIRRQEATLRERLSQTPLEFSDTLLLVTARRRLDELRQQEGLIITSELDLHVRHTRLWWLPLALVPAIVLLAATESVDIMTGVLISVVLLLTLGVITPRETYRSIDWSVIFFVAAFIPVGEAMFDTGLAQRLAGIALTVERFVSPELAPWVALSMLYLFTSLLTESLSNNAAAIMLTPIAIGMAQALGVDTRPFVFAVCFGASASFMTPTGYQTNMMVYGPGSYRFLDFVRFGAPLNLLFWLIATLLLPLFWPFR